MNIKIVEDFGAIIKLDNEVELGLRENTLEDIKFGKHHFDVCFKDGRPILNGWDIVELINKAHKEEMAIAELQNFTSDEPKFGEDWKREQTRLEKEMQGPEKE